MPNIENYIDSKGFIDIPKLISEGKVEDFFPGLNPGIENLRRKEFPALERNNRIYLDSTATSQEPQSVKDRMFHYRTNTIRGSNHSKNSKEAREAQRMYDESRKKLEDFFHAHNYLTGFTSGTTNTSNWIASRFPFEKDDLLLITGMEHNSQILTARNIAKQAKANIKYIPFEEDGTLKIEYIEKIVSEQKKGKVLLNLVHVSNVSGVINPLDKIKDAVGYNCFIYLVMS